MNVSAASPALQVDRDEALSRTVLNKVAWRLVPFLCLLYIFNIIDRSNVGFARLTMQDDLRMDPWVFDYCYGLFYIGYLLFEVPSNLLQRRIGARRWIARIMISWGLVSSATLAVTGAWSFGSLRVLLGFAEAGFFPGIVYYLSCWFPARERARIIALFMIAVPAAGIVSNPISGVIMYYLDGVAGLNGWQWMFLLEGIPSITLGIAVLLHLTDRPEDANWLSAEERTWLVERMKREEHRQMQRHGGDLLKAAIDGRVWLLIAVYFTVAVGANAYGAYGPSLVKNLFAGSSTVEIGLLTALPPLCAVVAMTVMGMLSDRRGERRKHLSFAALLGAAGWALSGWAPNGWVGLAGLCLAQMGMMSMLPIFWAIPTSFLSGAAAAGGIALINSVANIGGASGPNLFGLIGVHGMAAALVAGGILALFVPHDSTPNQEIPGKQG
jgi:MFS transporter, ACS family, tartrate transporter